MAFTFLSITALVAVVLFTGFRIGTSTSTRVLWTVVLAAWAAPTTFLLGTLVTSTDQLGPAALGASLMVVLVFARDWVEHPTRELPLSRDQHAH